MAISDPKAAAASAEAPARRRLRLARSHDERVFAGLAGGIGTTLGIGPIWVRAAFVTLTAAGGTGLVLYLLGWAATLGATTTEVAAPAEPRRKLGLGLMLAGVMLALRATGIWFGDAVSASVVLVAFGTAAVWDRSGPALATAGRPASMPTRARIAVGLFLMVGGVVAFFGSVDALADITPVVVAVAATAGGTLLVFGPWLWRMTDDLTMERRERIRTQERAEISAHLHDSVLQTLALIQRSDDPRRMVTLARGQERELRTWLYGRADGREPDGLRSALESVAARTEQLHDVPVEIVVVGDVPTTDAIRAVVQAAAEAAGNAARHSGASKVSIFAEVGPDGVDVFVTDQGKGFVVADVAEDRRGVRESIVARMIRHAGEATVTSSPGEGTEVHLHLPREPR
jgi:signal transduction histidine kinase